MNTKTPQNEEHMLLYYRRSGRMLLGLIRFYRTQHAGDEFAHRLHRESKPFAIGQYSLARNRKLEVFGSVPFLTNDIRRLIDDFLNDNNTWNAKRSRAISDAEIAAVDSAHDRKVMDFVILVATHTRNLFDLIPRFNTTAIPRLNHKNSPDGEVTLRELFDTLIHNRYYYFDGERIRDLFSDVFKKKKSALSGRFMGYGFNVLDFVKAISRITEEVKARDLTQILWRKFRDFGSDSRPQDVVSLIQNVHALSEFLKAQMLVKKHDFMTKLMFDEMDGSVEGAVVDRLLDGKVILTHKKMIFGLPDIKISQDLSRKEFEIRFRGVVCGPNENPVREEIPDRTVRTGFEDFLRAVNQDFGDDRLLGSEPLQITEVPAD